ncbi:hypothetical protein Amet_3134 [Alkaliphilus metalliredigens QYMF]|uniref:Uncharacterized protein n=1 Tax=Alkaliphilus metalliredigens (strain QYMF) TaxID=293826 RepID=A6TSV5_ALKMQ|nr:hypothetical protein [Alkaliphilus metalliredigens]ABR49273.1 hypothetical protein Amet_3134 [Alkaliphilus metalliredigens QYMF]
MSIDKISNIIYPELFKTKYIYVYNTLNEELRELIEESGYKKDFIKKYRRSLRMLEDLRENCTKHKTFEKLTDAKDIFSMRLIGQKNIRILFTFVQLNNRDIAVLLYAFQEKDNKNNSKTSYNNAIGIVEERISCLKR